MAVERVPCLALYRDEVQVTGGLTRGLGLRAVVEPRLANSRPSNEVSHLLGSRAIPYPKPPPPTRAGVREGDGGVVGKRGCEATDEREGSGETAKAGSKVSPITYSEGIAPRQSAPGAPTTVPTRGGRGEQIATNNIEESNGTAHYRRRTAGREGSVRLR